MSKTKMVLLAAGASLAMVSTFGCGGSKATVSDIKGDEEVVSIRNELLELCNKEYIKDNFCGIGQGKSNSESVASQVANTAAKADLASSVQTGIESRAKNFFMNSPDGQAMEGAAARAIANVSQDIVDVRTQKTRMMYNKAENQFTVYTLVTSSRTAAMELAKQKLRASQELVEIQRTINLDANVDRILD
ncbi:MAG: hypothetical protein FWC15_04710 [Fibromonadales bacterium]|nr:hypothetical protein [Fibromonadales bacterium]